MGHNGLLNQPLPFSVCWCIFLPIFPYSVFLRLIHPGHSIKIFKPLFPRTPEQWPRVSVAGSWITRHGVGLVFLTKDLIDEYQKRLRVVYFLKTSWNWWAFVLVRGECFGKVFSGVFFFWFWGFWIRTLQHHSFKDGVFHLGGLLRRARRVSERGFPVARAFLLVGLRWQRVCLVLLGGSDGGMTDLGD